MVRASWLLLVAACGTTGVSPQASAPPRDAILLVSIDGFRAEYLDRTWAVQLRQLAGEGVRAQWLTPVFPSKTFPNHYTIVTGLYPEHHGIVANSMMDPATHRRFEIRDTLAVRDSSWWKGEPIWVTAVEQGRKTGVYFWPGSEAAIEGVRPTYWKRYDARTPNLARVRQVLDWLSAPAPQAVSLAMLYMSDVDYAGHEYGPDAPQTDSAIARVDTAIGQLLTGLDQRGLAARVDLMVVSDHGMTATGPERTIFLDDYIDLRDVSIVDMSPVAAILPREGRGEEVFRRLDGANPHLTVYRKGEAPVQWHYRNNDRIPPILAVADEGWLISIHGRRSAPGLHPERGTHGYDPELPSMRALFIARGPAFRSGVTVPAFTNVHLYALMAHILGLQPAPNDGTLDSVRTLLRTGP